MNKSSKIIWGALLIGSLALLLIYGSSLEQIFVPSQEDTRPVMGNPGVVGPTGPPNIIGPTGPPPSY